MDEKAAEQVAGIMYCVLTCCMNSKGGKTYEWSKGLLSKYQASYDTCMYCISLLCHVER